MPIESATDASLVGAVAAIITGAGLAIRQLRHTIGSDTANAVTEAQDKANKALFEMLETRLRSQADELAALREENRLLRAELAVVHAELRDMRERCGSYLERTNS